MTLTNELNLPEPIVNAIRNDNYSAGESDYSTTTLISPPRIVALRRKYGKHITEDASDRIFALVGQAIHTVLERAADARYIVEKRYFAKFGDITIGGQIDVFDLQTAMLSDYKLCSRYVTNDGVKPEWVAQASVNRLLMRRNGINVSKAQIVAIFRDWSKMAAGRTVDYPPRQVQILPVTLWPLDKTEEYVLERIALHEAAKTELPECTPEERWEKPSKFALMKKGQKRAIKLYDTEAEALNAVVGPAQFVEPRPGENVRCEHFCSVAPYCGFYQQLMQEKAA